MTPPRTATTEARGAFLAGEAPASPAIFDVSGIQPVEIGHHFHMKYPDGTVQSVVYSKAIFIPVSNHADSILTDEVIHK